MSSTKWAESIPLSIITPPVRKRLIAFRIGKVESSFADTRSSILRILRAFRQRSLGLWGPVLLRDRKRRWLDVPSSSSWSRKGRGNFIDGGGGGGGVERLRVTNIDDVDGLRSLEGKEFGAPFRSILLPNPYFRAPSWNCISFISFNPSKFAQTCWVVRHDQELDHDSSSSSCSSISRHVCVSISVSSFSLN